MAKTRRPGSKPKKSPEPAKKPPADPTPEPTPEGDRLDVTSMWLDNPQLPGNPRSRGVLIWSRVKAQ